MNGIDHTVPVIVLCHVPIQASRGDNNGASYWNEALNYAATGAEGIASTGTNADIIRMSSFFTGTIIRMIRRSSILAQVLR